MDDQFVSLSDNLEYNFNQWYGDGDCPETETGLDAELGLGGSGTPEGLNSQHHAISDDSDEEDQGRPTNSASADPSRDGNLSFFAKLAKAKKVLQTLVETWTQTKPT